MQKMQETWVWYLGQGDPLEEALATHASILAWKISWIEETGELTLYGVTESDTTEHTCACTHTYARTHTHIHTHTHTHTHSLSPYHNIAQHTPNQLATLKQIPHPNYFLLSPLLKFELRHNHLLPESIILLTNFPASFLPPTVCFPYSSQGVYLQVQNKSQCCSA